MTVDNSLRRVYNSNIFKMTLTEKVLGHFAFQRAAGRCDAVRKAPAGSFPSRSAETDSKRTRLLTVTEFEWQGIRLCSLQSEW